MKNALATRQFTDDRFVGKMVVFFETGRNWHNLENDQIVAEVLGVYFAADQGADLGEVESWYYFSANNFRQIERKDKEGSWAAEFARRTGMELLRKIIAGLFAADPALQGEIIAKDKQVEIEALKAEVDRIGEELKEAKERLKAARRK